MKEALAFLLTCLLLAVQVFGHSAPAGPHHCRLVGRRLKGLMPPHPWSAPRVAGVCGGPTGASPLRDEAEQEDTADVLGLLERSMRGLALHQSWSLLAVQEGALSAVLQALRLSLRVSGEMAAQVRQRQRQQQEGGGDWKVCE